MNDESKTTRLVLGTPEERRDALAALAVEFCNRAEELGCYAMVSIESPLQEPNAYASHVEGTRGNLDQATRSIGRLIRENAEASGEDVSYVADASIAAAKGATLYKVVL